MGAGWFSVASASKHSIMLAYSLESPQVEKVIMSAEMNKIYLAMTLLMLEKLLTQNFEGYGGVIVQWHLSYAPLAHVWLARLYKAVLLTSSNAMSAVKYCPLTAGSGNTQP